MSHDPLWVVVLGQAVPPQDGDTDTTALLLLVPRPQPPHAPQLPQLQPQFTGQHLLLHALVSERWEQVPPQVWILVTRRCLFWLPEEPQDCVHALHEDQPLNAQFEALHLRLRLLDVHHASESSTKNPKMTKRRSNSFPLSSIVTPNRAKSFEAVFERLLTYGCSR